MYNVSTISRTFHWLIPNFSSFFVVWCNFNFDWLKLKLFLSCLNEFTPFQNTQMISVKSPLRHFIQMESERIDLLFIYAYEWNVYCIFLYWTRTSGSRKFTWNFINNQIKSPIHRLLSISCLHRKRNKVWNFQESKMCSNDISLWQINSKKSCCRFSIYWWDHHNGQ